MSNAIKSARGVLQAQSWCRSLLILSMLLVASTGVSSAQPSTTTTNTKVALVGFDALGMDSERVLRLETLFHKELERLSGNPVPNRLSVQKLSRRLQRCDGQSKCLAAIGKALNVDYVISGNVAALGDSFILNIKAIDVTAGKELRRIESDPLRGQPEKLIDSIRVAAYRLFAPEQLQGAILVLADREGAKVEIDGKLVGVTPLRTPIFKLPLGPHQLRVDGAEFGSFQREVIVRFQKTTRVIVRLVDLRVKSDTPKTTETKLVILHRDPPKKWYQKTWFLVGAGIGAALVAGYIGFRITNESTIRCGGEISCQ
ncbi:MAG: PEGA domain-containing protein [Kofleriaceae bacterium]|nr:PEGA domain-containing protein [Kofleriaceae bacterium]